MFHRSSTVNRALQSLVMVSFAAMAMVACGTGGIGGNSISGNLSYNNGSTARMNFLVAGEEPMTGTLVQLVDLDGNVVAETYVDANGNFTFNGVLEGDYTLVIVDSATGEVITEVNVTLLEGDDAKITGSFTDSSVTWSVEFDSNDGSTLNETQQERVNKLAELSGLSADEITQMRLSGMGWGQIAHELGIHPGNLGMGHKDGFEPKKNGSAKGAKGDKGNNGKGPKGKTE